MQQSYKVRVTSKLYANPKAVWKHMSSMDGVNYELMPFVHMTYPEKGSLDDHDAVPVKSVLFTSILLLFGFIPFDAHWLSFDNFIRGRGFDENSSSLLQKHWKHSRHIHGIDETKEQDGTFQHIEVEDHLEFTPRAPFVGFLVLPIVRMIFNHRHAQLRKKFAT